MTARSKEFEWAANRQAELPAHLRSPPAARKDRSAASGIGLPAADKGTAQHETQNHQPKVVQELLRLQELARLKTIQVSRPNAFRQIIKEAYGTANLIVGLPPNDQSQAACTDLTELRYADGRE